MWNLNVTWQSVTRSFNPYSMLSCTWGNDERKPYHFVSKQFYTRFPWVCCGFFCSMQWRVVEAFLHTSLCHLHCHLWTITTIVSKLLQHLSSSLGIVLWQKIFNILLKHLNLIWNTPTFVWSSFSTLMYTEAPLATNLFHAVDSEIPLSELVYFVTVRFAMTKWVDSSCFKLDFLPNIASAKSFSSYCDLCFSTKLKSMMKHNGQD